MIDLMYLKELTLTKPLVFRGSVFFVITGTFLRQILESRIYDGCHDLLQKVMSFNDVALVSVKTC